jgi:hypothetical protein
MKVTTLASSSSSATFLSISDSTFSIFFLSSAAEVAGRLGGDGGAGQLHLLTVSAEDTS